MWTPCTRSLVDCMTLMLGQHAAQGRLMHQPASKQHAPGAEPEGTADQATASDPAAQDASQAAAEDRLEDNLAQLDLYLTYLWRVHGIDYYGGREVREPHITRHPWSRVSVDTKMGMMLGPR